MGGKESVEPLEVSEQRAKIKRVARALFAERGLRNVTVREIAIAAGQRNMGVVGYYFGTKENLVAEILIDGAAQVEAHRMAHLARIEAGGGPHSVLEVIEAIVLPTTAFVASDAENGSNFNRFLMQVSLSDESFIDRTLAGRWNTGYQRCLAHLRRLMPDLSAAEQNRRVLFLGRYLGGLLAVREAMSADQTRSHVTWRADATLQDIIATAAAIIEAPAADRRVDYKT